MAPDKDDPRTWITQNPEARQENLNKQVAQFVLKVTVCPGTVPKHLRDFSDLEQLNRHSTLKFGCFKFATDRTEHVAIAGFLNTNKHRKTLPELIQFADLLDSYPGDNAVLVTKYASSTGLVGYMAVESTWAHILSGGPPLPCSMARHDLGDGSSTTIFRAPLGVLLSWYTAIPGNNRWLSPAILNP